MGKDPGRACFSFLALPGCSSSSFSSDICQLSSSLCSSQPHKQCSVLSPFSQSPLPGTQKYKHSVDCVTTDGATAYTMRRSITQRIKTQGRRSMTWQERLLQTSDPVVICQAMPAHFQTVLNISHQSSQKLPGYTGNVDFPLEPGATTTWCPQQECERSPLSSQVELMC